MACPSSWAGRMNCATWRNCAATIAGCRREDNPPPICGEGETGVGGQPERRMRIGERFLSQHSAERPANRPRSWGQPVTNSGVIGSTDTHLSASGEVDESGWRGHTVSETDLSERLTPSRVHPIGLYTNPGGLPGVWAVENSRDALFDALKRREVFGTSGPRIRPRFFGGWDFADGACASPAETGYAGGVPMGADMPAQSSGRAPRFIVSAERDRGSSPLLRLQVIKGWIDDGRRCQLQGV